MKFANEWIQHLKNRKEEIKNKLEAEGVNVEQVLQEEVAGIFASHLKATTLKELKMACIMDRFTLDSYQPECNLLELTPDGWKKEIDAFEPELIFIESAWQGKDKLWYRKIANGSNELYEMTNYCQNREIPIIFWNKEDPIYTDTFMPAARCADVVFTTDIDCVKKYKDNLDHDNVFFLHFAAQPKVHNPIEKFERKDKFCFAGAYYHRYPKRAEVFDKFAKIFMDTKGFDIYDRNYGNSLPEHAFPEYYNPYILGKLDPSEIDIAYKGYHFGINMNSVQQSQTMFARRVFEMLASNTVTVGNYSRGVKNFFGDLTICTDDDLTMNHCLQEWCMEEVIYRKYRLLGLRSVLQNHLYEDRLGYIVQKVFHKDLKPKLPRVYCLAMADADNTAYILRNFSGQTYENKELYLIGDGIEIPEGYANVNIISEAEAAAMPIHELVQNGLVGVMSGSHYYGPNYLMDMCLTLRYAAFHAIGKANYYAYTGNAYELNGTDATYRTVQQLDADKAVFQSHALQSAGYTVGALVQSKMVQMDHMFAVDEFNFCADYQAESCKMVDDLEMADCGIPLSEIERAAESIKRDMSSEATKITAEELLQWSRGAWKNNLECRPVNGGMEIKSTVPDKTVQYVYFNKIFDVSKFAKNEKMSLLFNALGGLDIMCTCIWLDAEQNKISPCFTKMSVFHLEDVPQKAKYFRLGVRISGSGSVTIKNVVLGAERNPEELSTFLSRTNKLILTNQYPSPDSLYRNMFVHKRVLEYKKEHLVCDVMRMNLWSSNEFREFEGINIIEGQEERLANILSTGQIDTVCVHFMDRKMWNILKLFGRRIQIIVWLHGADIQPWWRRKCNYTTKEALEKAKQESDDRQQLWKEIFQEADNDNIHFVFVSNYSAEETFEDYQIRLPEEKYSIIHNCIDTEMFQYVPKDAEQRKKILSIRPYANHNYANDLSVKCILELSKKPFFKELQFRMVGNGDYFDEIVKPLKKMSNVTLDKCFLRQDEIAELHKEYGIFLNPTRLDTQGVSRDEAMASGLVPVTNAVTAIPEFVDENCGILAPGEDYLAMAAGIEELYHNPEHFAELSQNASERVAKQTSKKQTIMKEIMLIEGK